MLDAVLMLRAYYYFIQFRMDFVLFALLLISGCVIARRHLSRRGQQYRISAKIYLTVAALIVGGGLIAEWAADNRIRGLQRLFAAFGPTYANELARAGHASITLETPPDDPTYLRLIEMEKSWLQLNRVIADIYTYRKDAEGRMRLIVDSETDYNHSGEIDDDREQRTAIGEPYPEATPKFFWALEGETVFESAFMPDRWGIWVSSFTPIFGPDGHVEAALGIDYPAEQWLREIGSVRAMVLGIDFVLVAILITCGAFIALLAGEIEERKQALGRLEQARESALQSSAAKSEFLAVTSHEVRTPLAAILGFANILADTKLDPTQRRYLSTLSHAGERLIDLLNTILDYTQIETGKLALEKAPWAPAILIHEVIETMSALALQKSLALNFDNHLPNDLTLKGDANRVRQILLNLLGNGVKYTSNGGITVRANWFANPSDPTLGRMSIAVIDTGPGIPAEKLPHLFTAFAQVDSATTRKHTESGLGLAICKRLADLMNGDLTVATTMGTGTEFTLALDCTVTQPPAASAKPVSGSNASPKYAGRSLVVDDQRLNRELLKVMLRRCGLEADLAGSGPEAVEMAAKNSYAIIFTDLEMPDMDGFMTAQQIRAAEFPGHRVPIIAISALTVKGTRERCIAAGMDDYLTKPVYLPALDSALAAHLSAAATTAKALAPVASGIS